MSWFSKDGRRYAGCARCWMLDKSSSGKASDELKCHDRRRSFSQRLLVDQHSLESLSLGVGCITFSCFHEKRLSINGMVREGYWMLRAPWLAFGIATGSAFTRKSKRIVSSTNLGDFRIAQGHEEDDPPATEPNSIRRDSMCGGSPRSELVAVRSGTVRSPVLGRMGVTIARR